MPILLGTGNAPKRFATTQTIAQATPAFGPEISEPETALQAPVSVAEATGNSGIVEPVVDATGAAIFDQKSNTSIRDDDLAAEVKTNVIAQLGSFVAIRNPDESVLIRRMTAEDSDSAGRDKRTWFKLSLPEGAGVDPQISGIVLLLIQVTGEQPVKEEAELVAEPAVATNAIETTPTPVTTAEPVVNDEMKE